MYKYLICSFLLIGFISCKQKEAQPKEDVVLWTPYNDSAEVAASAENENRRMRYKFIQSRVLDKNEVFLPLYDEVSQFTEAQYEQMKPLVLELLLLVRAKHLVSRLKYVLLQLALLLLVLLMHVFTWMPLRCS